MASSLEFRDNLLKTCERRDDIWGNDVKLRIVNCNDFPAVKARYHARCFNRFNATTMAPKRLESTLNSSFLQGSIDISRSAGRPIDFAKQMEFEQLCEWLESKSDLLSMSEVHKKLVCCSSDPDNV